MSLSLALSSLPPRRRLRLVIESVQDLVQNAAAYCAAAIAATAAGCTRHAKRLPQDYY